MLRPILGLFSALALCPTAWSLQDPGARHDASPQYRSHLWDGAGDAARMVEEYVVHEPGARWLQLEFSDSELGQASWVRLWSLADGGDQELRTTSLRQWNGFSAIFNGDTVVVQLFAAPGDEGVFVELGPARVGPAPPAGTKSLCGADDRVPSTDNRVGRIFFGGCSAWRVTNGAFMTGGHCMSTFQAGDVVEFNVPLSLPDGTTVAADPDDQYPVDLDSIVGTNLGLGKDWAMFAVGPNSDTQLWPHQVYGVGFRTSKETPSITNPGSIRLTGFGKDQSPPGATGGENEKSHTNQTSTGHLTGSGSSGSNAVWLVYDVDSEPGLSGGPVIWKELDLAIGINTHTGCNAGGNNKGTSFEVDEIEQALNAFPGPNARYVDLGHPLPVSPNGTIYRPFPDVGSGVLSTPAGGILSIVAGNYLAAAGNAVTVTSAVTLEAPMGGVVIGN